MKETLSDILSISAIFDIRAETLAANLLAYADGEMQGFGLEQVVVAAKGMARRRVDHDVAEVRKKYYEQDTALFIEVNRKGLFDTLPERLFLRLDEAYDTPIKRTKAIEQQIKDARKFFLPFEQAIFHPRIEAEQLEEKWTEGFPDFIKAVWGLPAFGKALDDRQRFLLCYLIPEAYRIVGNWNLTGLCFEAVLQKPVNLNFIPPMTLDNPTGEAAANELRLGEDTVVGTSFKDDMPALEVEIKAVTQEEIPNYLPGGDSRKILEDLLYSYFLPLDVMVKTKISVTEDAWGFSFDQAILGYNVQLKK